MALKWIKAIGSWFKNLGKGIGKAAVALFNSKEFKSLLKTAEGEIVQSVIEEVNAGNLGLDGHGWRAEVLKRVEERFKGAGLTFKEQLARMLMENIAARLKGLQ